MECPKPKTVISKTVVCFKTSRKKLERGLVWLNQKILVTLFTLLIFSVLQNAFQDTLLTYFRKFFKKLMRRHCQKLINILSTFCQKKFGFNVVKTFSCCFFWQLLQSCCYTVYLLSCHTFSELKFILTGLFINFYPLTPLLLRFNYFRMTTLAADTIHFLSYTNVATETLSRGTPDIANVAVQMPRLVCSLKV